jgi:hypothetical protein
MVTRPTESHASRLDPQLMRTPDFFGRPFWECLQGSSILTLTISIPMSVIPITRRCDNLR